MQDAVPFGFKVIPALSGLAGMPLVPREDDEDGTDGSRGSQKRSVTACGNNITTVLVQTILGDREGSARVLSCLDPKTITKINWNSNPGNVIELLVASLGLDFSPDGTMLWRKAEPAKPLNMLETISPNTRMPKPPRDTVIGQLANLNLVHDAEPSATGGSRAAQTTRDARPATPRALELARPDAIDRVHVCGHECSPAPGSKQTSSSELQVHGGMYEREHRRLCAQTTVNLMHQGRARLTCVRGRSQAARAALTVFQHAV